MAGEKICKYCCNYTPSPVDHGQGKCWASCTMLLEVESDAIPWDTKCENCPSFKELKDPDGDSYFWEIIPVCIKPMEKIDDVGELFLKQKRNGVKNLCIIGLSLFAGWMLGGFIWDFLTESVFSSNSVSIWG